MKTDRIRVLMLAVLILQVACSSQQQQAPSAPLAREAQSSPPATPPAQPPASQVPETQKPAEPVPPPQKPPKIERVPAPAPLSPKPDPALLNPTLATARAPEQYRVRFETSKGNVVLQVNRSSAPLGADRFYNLVKMGYFNDVAFFRVIDGFMAQFGIHGDPKVNEKWESARISDDAVKDSNVRGAISFATAGPDTRTTQLFINYGDNSTLDSRGFAPFGKVVQGMEVIDALYKDYGEGAPRGGGPSQELVQSQGNNYLRARFPKLDYIKRAAVLK